MNHETDAMILGFEGSVRSNGEAYWSAREFCQFLGYADYRTFKRAIDRAASACMSLNIPVSENFKQAKLTVNGDVFDDLKLTRFACYLVAMNADPRKERVAKAQAYFAGLAETFREYVEAVQEVERLVIRGDLVDEEKNLAHTASSHLVENYAFFQNAGYRGMYNRNLNDLRQLKGVPGTRSPLDFMHSEELAANLFRITQTNAKIRNEGIMGQQALEGTAQEVGGIVRRTMIELSGTAPEDLPPADDLREVKTKLRATQRALKKMDALPSGKQA